MKTTCDYLDAIKARHNLPSDYALAKKLEISRAAISNLRKHRDCMSDQTAIKAAALLEIDSSIVLATLHAERAKSDAERNAWQAIIEKLGGLAASVLMGVSLAGAPATAEARAFDNNGQNAPFIRHAGTVYTLFGCADESATQ